MEDLLNHILSDTALTPAQKEYLHTALATDPALADAMTQWHQVQSVVRARLEASVPDREMLACFALEVHGAPLTSEESQSLEAVRTNLDQALQNHPALADVVQDIQHCAADFDAAWDAHFSPQQPSPPGRPASRRSQRQPIQRWGWRIGVSTALVAFMAVFLLLQQRDHNLITLETAADEVRRIELADGSSVRLLGNASLVYPNPEKTTTFSRRVRLLGRAFFDIVPNGKTFTVETPTALATALGTTFGVHAEEAATEVTLVEGRLALAQKAVPDRPVMLEPGQQSRVVPNALPATPTSVDITDALNWPGLFVFRETTLSEIVTRLSERYGAGITLAPALAEETVHGTFSQDQPLPEILQTLAATLGAHMQQNASGGYHLALN